MAYEFDAFGNITGGIDDNTVYQEPEGGWGVMGPPNAASQPNYQTPEQKKQTLLYGGIPQKFVDDALAQIAQQAGLPAGFDWTPFLEQAAQQHQAQFGTGYSNAYTNYAHPVAAAVQTAAQSNPQLQPFVASVGPGSDFWNQGNQMRDQALHNRTSDSEYYAPAAVLGAPLAIAGLGALGIGGGAGTAGGAAAGDAGVTVGSLANTAAPEVIGTATGAGQFVNAAGQALPAMAGVAPELAAGSMASGVFTPAAQGAMTGGGAAAGSTALGRLLGLGQQGQDIASVAGAVLPSVLGLYGASQQTDAYKDLANQYASYGEPYRSKLSELYANPMGYLSSPEVTGAVQQGTDILARSLSTHGNPAGSGSALQELQNYATNQQLNRIGSEKDRLAGFGGLSAYSAAAPAAASNAIGSQANIYNAAGYGLGQVLNPQPTLADIFKQYGKAWGAV